MGAINLTKLGIDEAAKGNLTQAIALYRQALDLDPKLRICRAHLAMAQLSQGDYDGAIASIEQAIADGHNPIEGRTLIGMAWAYKGDLERALAFLSDKSNAVHRSAVLLAAGRFAQGWPLFDLRIEPTRHHAVPPPYWNNESLTGKSIFVWPEGVLGDSLIFSGLLPELVERADKVFVECKSSLVPIFKRSFPRAEIISQVRDQMPVPAPAGVDYQIPLNSLGKYFRPDFKSFPKHTGYLKSDPEKMARLRQRYEAMARGRKIVGLGWRSKNETHLGIKCATLADWEPILKIPGIFFVNLLTGDWQVEVDEVAAKLGVEVFRDDEIVEGIEQVFAHAAAMDLIVSTSNTVIHAAGTQNIPGWLVLPNGMGPLWYWFRDREDSPFYPSVRVFRQPRDVIDERWWTIPVDRAARELASGVRR